jgi:NADH:ubiquinone oxidoreductase subunit E
MMDEKKADVVICMGSSCFARGNERNLAAIEEFVAKQPWRDCVELRGCHCMGQCSHGPNLCINGKTYHAVDEGTAIDLLKANVPVGKRE